MDQGASIDKSAGLCATCSHVERIRSDRGSVFYRCLLSARDPRFAKYPRLPVVFCPGYEHTDRSLEQPELI
jgi:hypothetical protein